MKVFGDGDNDGFVKVADWDTNTNGSIDSGDACWGASPSGSCRLIDFDDDVDSADATVLNTLASSTTYRRPAQALSAVGNARAHQELIFDAEIDSHNNRRRQHAPAQRRFVQREPW